MCMLEVRPQCKHTKLVTYSSQCSSYSLRFPMIQNVAIATDKMWNIYGAMHNRCYFSITIHGNILKHLVAFVGGPSSEMHYS